MTIQELVDAVKGHIGNRETGLIGPVSVGDSVISSINRGLIKIAKSYAPHALQEDLEIDVDDTAYKYGVPTKKGSTDIRIKNYIAMVIKRDEETTGSLVLRLSPRSRDTVFPLTNTSHTGKPNYYSIFNDFIELYPFPNGDFTLYLRVNLWPVIVISTDTSSGLALEWDDVLEEFATSDCFAKLQQTKDSALWYALYKSSLASTIAMMESRPDWQPDINLKLLTSASLPYEPLNPFETGVQ